MVPNLYLFGSGSMLPVLPTILMSEMPIYSLVRCMNAMICENTFLFLDDLKRHIYNEHDGFSSISHFKHQLINQKFFDETFHFASDLHGKKKNKLSWECHTRRYKLSLTDN